MRWSPLRRETEQPLTGRGRSSEPPRRSGNRQYDDSFAKTGAKIGSTLKIRLPNRYTVRTGTTMDTQDTAETSVTLTVATQKGVDMAFTDQDLTLSMDDFSKRVLDPAMSVLAANIEADALSIQMGAFA